VGRFAVAGAGVLAVVRVIGRRDGVITTATPWMTAENPANSIPRAAEGAVKLHCLQEIVRAGWREAAADTGAGGEFQHRVEDPLIETDHQSDDGTEDA